MASCCRGGYEANAGMASCCHGGYAAHAVGVYNGILQSASGCSRGHTRRGGRRRHTGSVDGECGYAGAPFGEHTRCPCPRVTPHPCDNERNPERGSCGKRYPNKRDPQGSNRPSQSSFRSGEEGRLHNVSVCIQEYELKLQEAAKKEAELRDAHSAHLIQVRSVWLVCVCVSVCACVFCVMCGGGHYETWST